MFVEKKSGFSCKLNGMLKIKDKGGRLFYARRCEGYTRFNLPSGIFLSNTPLKRLKQPLKYKTAELPPAEKNRPKPKEIIIRFEQNPNKATIYLTAGKYVIMLDTFFRSIGRLYRTFVTYHELGHHFYKTEQLADKFAYVAMIEEGYNPSQVFYAAYLTLNKFVSIDRIRAMLFNTLKQNTYEQR